MKNIKNNINIYKANQKITKTKKQYGGAGTSATNVSLSIDDEIQVTLTGFDKQMFLKLLKEPKDPNTEIQKININKCFNTTSINFETIVSILNKYHFERVVSDTILSGEFALQTEKNEESTSDVYIIDNNFLYINY